MSKAVRRKIAYCWLLDTNDASQERELSEMYVMYA